jgi:hypothetical protein
MKVKESCGVVLKLATRKNPKKRTIREGKCFTTADEYKLDIHCDDGDDSFTCSANKHVWLKLGVNCSRSGFKRQTRSGDAVNVNDLMDKICHLRIKSNKSKVLILLDGKIINDGVITFHESLSNSSNQIRKYLWQAMQCQQRQEQTTIMNSIQST